MLPRLAVSWLLAQTPLSPPNPGAGRTVNNEKQACAIRLTCCP
jgi:hypothetical protein